MSYLQKKCGHGKLRHDGIKESLFINFMTSNRDEKKNLYGSSPLEARLYVF